MSISAMFLAAPNLQFFKKKGKDGQPLNTNLGANESLTTTDATNDPESARTSTSPTTILNEVSDAMEGWSGVEGGKASVR